MLEEPSDSELDNSNSEPVELPEGQFLVERLIARKTKVNHVPQSYNVLSCIATLIIVT